MSREQIRSTGAMDARGRGHKGNQVDELGEATDVDRTQERRYRRFPCHRQFLDTMVIVGATVRIHVRRLPSICTQLVLNSIYCPFLPLLPTQPWKTLICQLGSPLSPHPNTLSHRPPRGKNLRHSSYGGVLDIFSLAHRRCTVGLHSALNTFFQTAVSGDEKRSRMQERMSGSCLVTFLLSPISLPLIPNPSFSGITATL